MLKPIHDRVLIERESLKAKTSIIIPEDAEKRNAPAYGCIVAVGDTVEHPDVRPGRTVVFGRYAGDWIEDPDGREVYVCKDTDIIAVVD